MNKKAIILSLSATLAITSLQAQSKPELSLMIGNVKSDSDLNLKREKNIGIRLQCTNEDKMKKFSFGNLTHELSISRNISKIDYKTAGNGKTNITRVGINGILNFNTNNKLVPYALLGLGKEFVSSEKSENDDDGFYNYGVGIKYPINNYSLRLEAQQIEHFDRDGDRFAIFAGLAYKFGSSKSTVAPKEIVKKEILDNDNDGVIGINDKCPYSKDGVKVDENGCEIKSIIKTEIKKVEKVEEVILDTKFKVNSNQFKFPNTANAEISKFANYIKSDNLLVVIAGHTSSEGSARGNLRLSQKRANRVRSELIKLGVDASKVVALGYGESKPLTSDSTESANRRIETRKFTSIDEFTQYVSDTKDSLATKALIEQK